MGCSVPPRSPSNGVDEDGWAYFQSTSPHILTAVRSIGVDHVRINYLGMKYINPDELATIKEKKQLLKFLKSFLL